MATKLPRALLKLFGSTGATSKFGKFGSQAAGSPVNTKDVSIIQSLSNYLDGWQTAINVGSKAPYLQDMNSLFYLLCYQMVYQFQEGIVEFDLTTTYFANSIVKKTGTLELYSCIDALGAGTVGTALPSQATNGFWKYLGNFGDLNNASNLINTISDAVHGTRAGGTLHPLAIANSTSGFLSGTDKSKIDTFVSGVSVKFATGNLVCNGSQSLGGFLNLNAGTYSGAWESLYIPSAFTSGSTILIFSGITDLVEGGLGAVSSSQIKTPSSADFNPPFLGTLESGDYKCSLITTGTLRARANFIFIGIK